MFYFEAETNTGKMLKKTQEFFCLNRSLATLNRHSSWYMQLESSCIINIEQECIPVGCVPFAAVAFLGRGCLPKGRCVCLGSVHQPWPRGRHRLHSPPWTEFLTHAYENITFLQLLLRTVKNLSWILTKTRMHSNRMHTICCSGCH